MGTSVKMKKIKLKSTSKTSAVTDDVLLRETQTTRLIFRPLVIDNARNQKASVKGSFLFQKKKNGDSWEDHNELNLSTLKAEEWVKLNLKGEEILSLYKSLTDLYSVYQLEGIPSGESEYIKADAGLNALLTADSSQFLALLDQQPDNALELISRFMSWISSQSDFTKIIEKLDQIGVEELQQLNSIAGLSTLKSGLTIWEANIGNSNEEFWQKTFSQYSFILSQVFSYPVVIVNDKAYVGGKSIENTGGNVVDFLAKNEISNNAILIEIKTPTSKLLGSKYRQGTYSISGDLSGGVVQVSNYKYNLVSEYNSLRQGSDFEAFDPECLLIIGNHQSELDDNQKSKSFHLFRSNLKGVQVITFDELFSKVNTMIDLIEGRGEEISAEDDIPF